MSEIHLGLVWIRDVVVHSMSGYDTLDQWVWMFVHFNIWALNILYALKILFQDCPSETVFWFILYLSIGSF